MPYSNNYNEKDDWECNPSDLMWEPPCSLRLEYWKRSSKTQRAKDDHVDYLETLPYSREELILRTTLADTDVAIEKNMFPYDTPPCIEHWTLWSREEMSHRSICMFVEDWCKNNPVAKDIIEWNYEENAHRSFDVPHVHVFFRFAQKPKLEEVRTSELISHSSKRSFSSVSDGSHSPTTTVPSDSEESTDTDSSRSAPRKKLCPTRVNVLLSSSSSSVSDEEGETDREDLSDSENVITKKQGKSLYSLRLNTRMLSSLSSSDQDASEDGLTDTEDL